MLKKVNSHSRLDETINQLNENINNYNLMLIHSINMVVSLKEKDMITYFELYETFDKLGVFNSNWEEEMTKKLNQIDNNLSTIQIGIQNLLFSVKSMETTISDGLNRLTYVTKSSFEKLNLSVNSELKSIRSGVEWNTLLTGIQSYQTHRLRQGK